MTSTYMIHQVTASHQHGTYGKFSTIRHAKDAAVLLIWKFNQIIQDEAAMPRYSYIIQRYREWSPAGDLGVADSDQVTSLVGGRVGCVSILDDRDVDAEYENLAIGFWPKDLSMDAPGGWSEVIGVTRPEEKLPPSEWQRLTEIRVIDQDGWRQGFRTDGKAWAPRNWDASITFDEWTARSGISTVARPRRALAVD